MYPVGSLTNALRHHDSCERRDIARGKGCRSPGCTREVRELLVYQIEVLEDVLRQDLSDGKNAERSLLHPERLVAEMPVFSATKSCFSRKCRRQVVNSTAVSDSGNARWRTQTLTCALNVKTA